MVNQVNNPTASAAESSQTQDTDNPTPTQPPITTTPNSRTINEDTPQVPPTREGRVQFIQERAAEYRQGEARDEDLWEQFCFEFGAWKKEDFVDVLGAEGSQLGELRRVLRWNGVYVPGSGSTLPSLFIDILDAGGQEKWPAPAMNRMIENHESGTVEGSKRYFNSRYNPLILGSSAWRRIQKEQRHQEQEQLPNPSVKSSSSKALSSINESTNSHESRVPGLQHHHQSHTNSVADGRIPETQSVQDGPPPHAHFPHVLPQDDSRPADVGLYSPAPNSLGDVNNARPTASFASESHPILDIIENYKLPTKDSIKSVSRLQKDYQKEDKYRGAEDVLDNKLKIFIYMCYNAEVPKEALPRAFIVMLTDKAKQFFVDKLSMRKLTFATMVEEIRAHFETEQRRMACLQRWEDTRLDDFKAKNPNKTLLECFELMRDRLIFDQAVLRPELRTDAVIRDKLYAACRKIPECNFALMVRHPDFESASESLRNSLAITAETSALQGGFVTSSGSKHDNVNPQKCLHCMTERKFEGKTKRFNTGSTPTDKKCFVCGKIGCWSTRHTSAERQKSREKFKSTPKEKLDQYVVMIEGLDTNYDADFEAFCNEIDIEEQEQASASITTTAWVSEGYGNPEGSELFEQLERQATIHAFSATYKFSEPLTKGPLGAYLAGRYSSEVFIGIMIDTGAANKSTAGLSQLKALQRLQKIDLNTDRAGEAEVQFGIGSSTSIGTALVETPIGPITFHIVPAETPFLLCLQDLDKCKVYYDNIENSLIGQKRKTPIVRAFGHPWMLLDGVTALVHLDHTWGDGPDIGCHLLYAQYKRLHRRFGHCSARRMHKVLEQAGYKPNLDELQRLNKECHECQISGAAPGRYKFTVTDDMDFNHTIIVDVFSLPDGQVLHLVDVGTAFQAARFLENMSAEHTWDTIRAMWIDTYVGPPAYIAHDPGTNFAAAEFRQSAKMMDTEVLQQPVEAHNSIGKIERYHVPLRRAYNIISREIPNLSKEMRLQMAVKAINDTVGPHGLVPTLLVFGCFPRMTRNDAPSVSLAQRSLAVKKAMVEVKRCHAARKVADGLRMRNGPVTTHLGELPLNAEVLVWREGRGWSGPYRMTAKDGETIQVEINERLVSFRSTVVKPYIRPAPEIITDAPPTPSEVENSPDDTMEPLQQPETRRSNRNRREQPQNTTTQAADDVPEDTIIVDTSDQAFATSFLNTLWDESLEGVEQLEVFITEKETRAKQISLELRAKGIINTPGGQFVLSRRKEMDGLLAQGVYEIISRHADEVKGNRIFGSRLVDEVKGLETATPYEKSRLVVQAYNDRGKKQILTQSPTIQRVSQRIIVAAAPTARKTRNARMILRDITQAYIQSKGKLHRPFFTNPPKEMASDFPDEVLLKMIGPLYGIPESGTFWFDFYWKHILEKLQMKISTFDPCLMLSTTSQFGIVGLQTDDTLMLCDDDFVAKEEVQLQEAKLLAKPIEQLTKETPLLFNGCRLVEDGDNLYLSQKGQGKRLELVDMDSPHRHQMYLEQRARGAYLASICQPEAAFDCSIAAQHQDPGADEIKALNKRLQWQIDNQDRGLRYIPLDMATAKLFVFVDGSFANNPDLSSQIGYYMVLGNEEMGDSSFELVGNTLHWSSVKCKRVTRAVLASELYAMVLGADMAISVSGTLNMIATQLGVGPIPVVICTDSFSLYECMVKLGTTKEKRLMIDIMALRQSYERKEISEIRWIAGDCNPADAMTKSSPNSALRQLIDDNRLKVKVEAWVDR